ncbi:MULTISPECIES: HIT domain-containing protein [unclassified Colwellia]|jgi:diadenosine tetraphosphate (Ap4A) HIT family hydrolase|uniref:HIT domain-containing protein n=1 Tax=unclassified Colwellia TaxID=196834 RepID=UPI0015F73216|nr:MULTISPECIES: HIT domain-containing protein [unclassified Colwellia]MBA6364195.1 HIT domain-containing protein [Colwellia sp. BRX8-8]MBA6339073.1 HIT domain-containing protein [Colwellia sp. BRX8-7]MBA6349757.1 HIT domain-containing protein [Colwellia sp. BRX8-9]MBA6353789.1 HIT domain-containing protein [Colwellia sp. BRX9-1]MBA6373253.1 HIT domain-containing protein [Colwellia sp. BRX8-4]|tara:strand:+ start:58 stop:486 length:429 start_codon:yes stop_codon:yes gene_type:complete
MSNTFQLHALLQRDTIELLELPLSTLLLMNDSNYPWFVLVPRVDDIQDIYQLDWQQQQQFLNESSLLSEILMQLFNGTKMNVAALGNICPQLHVHHIVRFADDIAWPKPVWGEFAMKAYTDSELTLLKEKVLPALTKIITQD